MSDKIIFDTIEREYTDYIDNDKLDSIVKTVLIICFIVLDVILIHSIFFT